jgi:hypothetical protein
MKVHLVSIRVGAKITRLLLAKKNVRVAFYFCKERFAATNAN